MVRDKVTFAIDARLKRAYEDVFGKNDWSKYLEEKTRERLLKSGKIEAIKTVIQIVDEEQEERRQLLIRIEKHISSLETEQEKVDVELENRREKWYLEHKQSLKKQYDDHRLRWNWLAGKLECKSGEEANAWYIARITKDDVHDRL